MGIEGQGSNTEAFLGERQVAELLQVSVQTVRRWRQRGEGPPYAKLVDSRLGAVRYAAADLESLDRVAAALEPDQARPRARGAQRPTRG